MSIVKSIKISKNEDISQIIKQIMEESAQKNDKGLYDFSLEDCYQALHQLRSNRAVKFLFKRKISTYQKIYKTIHVSGNVASLFTNIYLLPVKKMILSVPFVKNKVKASKDKMKKVSLAYVTYLVAEGVYKNKKKRDIEEVA